MLCLIVISWFLYSGYTCPRSIVLHFSVGQSWRCNKHSVLWNSCSERGLCSVISTELIQHFINSQLYCTFCHSYLHCHSHKIKQLIFCTFGMLAPQFLFFFLMWNCKDLRILHCTVSFEFHLDSWHWPWLK